ncbi:MAG: metallophosphoesterase family protein [Phycisphaerales bacterium]|nr:metallophosphoesterase family protein [Phycisphaerales bacterium]
MRTAIISDVHGNLDALRVVMDHIDTQSVDRTICLGDIVGYGPNPVECVDIVADRCEWALMGNHDFGVLYEPTNFNAIAEQAAYWTRAQFDNGEDPQGAERRWRFLGQLRVRVKDGAFLCVHGSPRAPINEYMFPDDAMNSPVKMQQIFDRIERYGMVGHTHVPGVFTDEPDFYSPADLNNTYELTNTEKAIINPGSVGQPRDYDPRASYAILDEGHVEFHRLEYDVVAVAQKIRMIPELNDWLGERLIEGR